MNISGGYYLVQRLNFAVKRLWRSLVSAERHQAFRHPGDGTPDHIEAAYVINLDRQSFRWKEFTTEARRQRTDRGELLLSFCHRVSAVDGKILDETQANGIVAPTYPLDDQYYVDPDPRLLELIRERDVAISMSREEIAVALSHVKAWRRVAAENRPYALILEDDVFFESGFATQLNRAWKDLPKGTDNCPSFDLLYLSFREVERGAQRTTYSPNLCRPLRGYWWLSGYVLSCSGAKKLLQLLPVVGPVDLWMNHRLTDLQAYSTPKSLVSQRTDFQSDNRYSILPLLSQIGVQSDKTHLVLEQTRGRRPVFVTGFDRESAGILESALGLLSYRCCNDLWDSLSANVGTLLDKNLPLLFDAYVHVKSVSQSLKEVRDLYPQAVFIMPPAWQEGSEVSPAEYSAARTELDGNGECLLIFDAHESTGWPTLCAFLSCETPIYPYPANRRCVHVVALGGDAVRRVPLADRQCMLQEHDVHPWIVPPARAAAFGIRSEPRKHGTQACAFETMRADNFSSFDHSRWAALRDSFPSNLAQFRPENISLLSPHGCRLTLDRYSSGKRDYSAGSFVSKQSNLYGRFEAKLRPARAPGLVTAFFLHRIDPWQEIDVELLGRDTTKLLVNVYFNPGDAGAICNFGNRGTPVVIDLGFDAAQNYHRYAIEWEPHELRWFVDDRLVHVRGIWEPTPIPDLPMALHCSVWPPKSVELAGELRTADLPAQSDIADIAIWNWAAAPQTAPHRAMSGFVEQDSVVIP